MSITSGFTTAEENYVAVVAFLSKIFPYVHNAEAQREMVAVMKEMVGIYPLIFRLDVVNGLPVITVIEEEKVN